MTNGVSKKGDVMKEKSLLLMNGYYRDYLDNEVIVSKVIAIQDVNSGIFKGIEISNQDCDLNDYYDILGYILKHYRDRSKFSLLIGYDNDLSFQYHNLSRTNKITFGKFDFDAKSSRFIGRERSCQGGILKRDLDRSINQYQVIEHTAEIPELYELIEVILLHAEKNSIWHGIECSVESSVPSKNKGAYILLASKGRMKAQ